MTDTLAIIDNDGNDDSFNLEQTLDRILRQLGGSFVQGRETLEGVVLLAQLVMQLKGQVEALQGEVKSTRKRVEHFQLLSLADSSNLRAYKSLIGARIFPKETAEESNAFTAAVEALRPSDEAKE